MGNISKHISAKEVVCQCGCGFDSVSPRLIEAIEDCAAHFEGEKGRRLPVIFTSWNRCFDHNASIGGADRSQHCTGSAVDFRINGIEDDDVAGYLEGKYPDSCGIGRYKGRTHLDVRKNRARWDKRHA